jgi:hypothetical protein
VERTITVRLPRAQDEALTRRARMVGKTRSAGDDLDVRPIFTLDRRGFSTYRTRSRKAFQVLPGL